MLENLKEDITALISLYEAQKTRADELSMQLAQSEASLSDCKRQITDLERQIDNLKLAGAFTGAGDSVMAKKRIDSLVGEIDKCIKLLQG